MSTSAKGTVEAPGRNVAQKSGLNRGLLHGRLGMARVMIEYKSRWMGRRAVAVPAQFSSQTCSACEHHPKDDETTKHLPHGRKDSLFTCPLCGFVCDADVNAALNHRRMALHIAGLAEKDRPLTRRESSRLKRVRSRQTIAEGHSVAARGALAGVRHTVAKQAANREVFEQHPVA
jgi:transposase